MSDKDKTDGAQGATEISTKAGTSVEVAEGKGAAPEAPGKKSPTTAAKPRRRLRFLWWLLVLIAIAGLVAAAYTLYQRQLQQQTQQEQQAAARITALQDKLAASQEKLSVLAQGQQRLGQLQTQQEQRVAVRLDDVEQRLSHQASRLRALSTTTREDWLLAEAEYLLKLANQRMLIERSTEAAEGLLEQADKILRDMADPQLTPLRRAIARDLTQLKLATRVDLEGLYLRLGSLAETVPQLPLLPSLDIPGQQPVPFEQAPQQSTDATADRGPNTLWQKTLAGLGGMLDGLDDFVRIRDHAETPAALLPPDTMAYLQQNLRMMLERSQLAAMREEAQLYRRSLESVQQWARRFYPQSQQRDTFIAEVKELTTLDVQQELPDISQSLQMLKDYIDRLHKLDGVEHPGNAPDDGVNEDGEQTEAQP